MPELAMSRNRAQRVVVLHRKHLAAPRVPQVESDVVDLTNNQKQATESDKQAKIDGDAVRMQRDDESTYVSMPG